MPRHSKQSIVGCIDHDTPILDPNVISPSINHVTHVRLPLFIEMIIHRWGSNGKNMEIPCDRLPYNWIFQIRKASRGISYQHL